MVFKSNIIDDIEELRTVAQGILPGVPLLVGGNAAHELQSEIRALGAHCIADLKELQSFLARRNSRQS